MTTLAETERVRRYYEQIAHRYDEYVGYFEKLLVGDGRRWVCSQARGEVLELAVGTGRNLPYYPADVRLTGVDLTPAMLTIARQRASDLGREVDLRVGDAQNLNLPDTRFDTVVATLALSSIPDDRRAMAEVWRVLRPGGQFLLLEHVRSPHLPVRLLQRVLDPLFVRCYGDHLLREPLDHLATIGFVVDREERSKGGMIKRLVARKPAAIP
ncbi:MAG TPA: class I SAM-dependent methyltransferase [Thermomicrobiales bacterium]|nr:class I SAM-dependent methyltransferase [Thermomicrobiales bacterium]